MTQAILFQQGQVVDGTGKPAWTGDVLIAGERLLAVGVDLMKTLPLGLMSSDVQQIDCREKMIVPGFIDVHTHDDAIVLEAPEMLPKLSQGITTVITGNCGISLTPYQIPQALPPLNLLGAHNFVHADFAAYAQAVTQTTPALNVAALIGHTTLRFACMQDMHQAATVQELEQMTALLTQCMRSGALGLSSGLFYEPAFAAPMQEVLHLAKVVQQFGGVYTTHLRTEMQAIMQALHEAGDTAFQAGVPLIISHHKCAGPANWGRTRETLPWIEALAKKQNVAMDVYPYLAGSTVLRDDLIDGVIDVMISWSEPYPETAGRMLADVAREWGVDQKAAAQRLQPGGACYFQIHEDDLRRVLQHPMSMVGSDGLPHDKHPHPRLWGTFPRVLGHYARDEGLFSMEQAVYKMTGLSARNFHLHQRGQLQAGWFADVVVLDPARVRDIATYEMPLVRSVGIEQVYVNGQLSYKEGALEVLQRAGRMLRRTSP